MHCSKAKVCVLAMVAGILVSSTMAQTNMPPEQSTAAAPSLLLMQDFQRYTPLKAPGPQAALPAVNRVPPVVSPRPVEPPVNPIVEKPRPAVPPPVEPPPMRAPEVAKPAEEQPLNADLTNLKGIV